MSKQLRLDVAQLTDVGRKRPHNEDNMAYVIPKDLQVMARKGALFIVADGMGGHAAGEVASEIAVDTVSNVYYQDDSEDVAVSLLHAIKRTNALIHQRAAENMLRSGMGTTCVTAVLRGDTALIANVGDSRAYLIRNGQARQVSQDHSWVEEQVRAGLLTRDQAHSHAQRNVITRSLGTQSDVEVDLFSEQLEEGDTLLLCSDGLSGYVTEDDLRVIVDQFAPQESVYRLVERANENGGPDNITAVVVRVLEVGWSAPGARRPVFAGGRENEDTAILGRVPSSTLNMAPRIDDGRIPSAPLRNASGPLLPQDNPSALAPALAARRKQRSRLFYPTLLLLMLLVVALIGGSVYYFLRPTVDVDQSFRDASALVSQANAEAASNPADALQKLGRAQGMIRQALDSSPSDTQHASLTNLLQGNLTATVKTAIVNYNQQFAITTLPCTNTVPTTLNNGGTNAQVDNVAAIQDDKGRSFWYALGDDHNLYQIDDHHSLVNKQNLAGNPQVKMIVSNGQRLFALTAQPGQGNAYTVSLLAPNGGALADKNDSLLDPELGKNGLIPRFIAGSSGDVYVVLVSDAAQNLATILDFPINADKLQQPKKMQIAISTSIVSVTAFPKNQLFLAYHDGSIQGLQFNTGNQPPVSLVVQHPIATPLGVKANDFTSDMKVPTPGGLSSSFLSVPGTSFLTTGMVDNAPHLFIVDGMYHRVIDLAIAQTAPVSSATPITSPTPTAGGAGGGVASSGPPISMELLQQYTSSSLLASVKGIVVDPKVPQLYLLTQNGSGNTTTNLLTVDVSQKVACTP
ncbi:MAG TPA: Stp1/IreP family PP2C-type Ser/Thr phosphatase [Ktedonobacteraceae bacterium]|nr:Stp1/IreP family PP2C-type Ser/Thr phosphatase [Ktedonobacteraceae bacterium]